MGKFFDHLGKGCAINQAQIGNFTGQIRLKGCWQRSQINFGPFLHQKTNHNGRFGAGAHVLGQGGGDGVKNVDVLGHGTSGHCYAPRLRS